MRTVFMFPPSRKKKGRERERTSHCLADKSSTLSTQQVANIVPLPSAAGQMVQNAFIRASYLKTAAAENNRGSQNTEVASIKPREQSERLGKTAESLRVNYKDIILITATSRSPKIYGGQREEKPPAVLCDWTFICVLVMQKVFAP